MGTYFPSKSALSLLTFMVCAAFAGSVCVYVCVCVRARARVCVCVCVCARWGKGGRSIQVDECVDR